MEDALPVVIEMLHESLGVIKELFRREATRENFIVFLDQQSRVIALLEVCKRCSGFVRSRRAVQLQQIITQVRELLNSDENPYRLLYGDEEPKGLLEGFERLRLSAKVSLV